MSKKFIVDVTVPEGLTAGDTFKVEVELPEKTKKPRGMLAGLSLEEMSDEQVKRELINANSVLYKAKQRGASDEVIAANQARVDAAKEERAKRGLDTKKLVATPVTEAEAEAESGVYNEDTAAEM